MNDCWCNNPIGVNILDITKREDGYYIGGQGATQPFVKYNGYSVSDFVKVNPGEVYHFTLVPGSSTGWGLAACYDKAKDWLFQITRKIYNSTTETFTVPDGVYYIRIDYGKTTNLKQQGDVTLERIS